MQTTDPMGMSENYTYDYQGNMLTKTDRNGNLFNYDYGIFGLEKTSVEGKSETKEYTYDNIGRLTGTKTVNANNEEVNESYIYDPFGRVIQHTSDDGSVQNYTYDLASNVTSYELKKNDVVKNSVTYAYDTLNRLTSLTNNGIITSYTYDPNGNLTQKAQDNGITTNYQYNKANLLSYMENKSGDTVDGYFKCKYFLNGLTDMIYMPYNGIDDEKIYSYDYDLAGQVCGEFVFEGDDTPVINWYSYDARGNRTEKSEESYTSEINEMTYTSYQYDLNNRLISTYYDIYDFNDDTYEEVSTTYTYDNNGNRLSSNAVVADSSTQKDINTSNLQTYSYDAFNRLTAYSSPETVAQYIYNADNLRTSKTVGNTTTDFVWNGQNMAAEYVSDNTNIYTYDVTGVHIANKANIVTSYLKDYHSNVIGSANASGTILQTEQEKTNYDSWGITLKGQSPDPFGYCGEYLDSESVLIYLRNRYYDSAVGAFITEDPIKDGLNWYAYCAGNPISFVDPLGLTYVPLREIIENLGGAVSWNGATKTATVTLDGQTTYATDRDGNGNFIDGTNGKMYSDDVWLFSALAITFDLGKGWTGRIEREASGGNSGRKHVHVYNGKKSYAQNEDGSPHDGSTGSPPSSAKESLKNKKGWDWDSKENDWVNRINIEAGVDGDGWVINYPDGRIVTIYNPRILGVPSPAPYPDVEALRKYYTGSTTINSPNGVNGSLGIIFTPNSVPIPAPAPAPPILVFS